MKKNEVQKRVLQNGKPLDLNKFEWDENTNTFSSAENNLVLDFRNIDYCTFKTGNNCTFDTDDYCTFKTGWNCTFKTGWNCTFDTDNNCTFDTDDYCTFKTGWSCTFDTDDYCTFKTGWSCTFKTGNNCTFKTGNNCTFDTGSDCVIITRHTNKMQIITPKEKVKLQLAPYGKKGYVENGIYSETGKPAIICDNILSEYTSKKEINGLEIYKIKDGYIVKDGELSAHGETIKQCKEDLKYKISNRDTSKYKDYTIATIVSQKEAIKMYRVITGACEFGTKEFCKTINLKKEYSIKEIIDITKGHYGNETFKKFFK